MRLLIGLLFSLFLLNSNAETALTAPIIVIDPGHGGADSGAIGSYYEGGKQRVFYEKDLNLQLANLLRGELAPLTQQIYLTRTSPSKYMTLKDRVQFANNLNADLFISIHHDSSTSKTAKGVSTHYSSYRPAIETVGAYVLIGGKKYPYVKEIDSYVYYLDNGVEKKVHINYCLVLDSTPSTEAIKSKILAEKLAQSLINLGYSPKYSLTGSVDHNLYVTRWATMPSVLIENGFMSNPEELKKISNPTMQQKTAKVIAQTIFNYYGFSLPEIKQVKVSHTSPQPTRQTITFDVQATGQNNLYKLYVYDGRTWRAVTNYTTNNKLSWTPENSGTYKISVHVKNKNSTQNYDDYYVMNFTVLNSSPKITSVKSNISSPHYINNEINFEVFTVGGSQNLFKYFIFDGTKWSLVQDYTTQSSLKWTPTREGDYKLSVHVKDSKSNKSYDHYYAVNFTVSKPPLKVTNINLSESSSLLKGKPVTITANVNTNDKTLYKFWVFDNEKWVQLNEYSFNSSIEWTPLKEGTHVLSVHVKSPTSSKKYDAYKAISFEVVGALPVNIQSITTSLSSPQNVGNTIGIEVNTEGGNEVLYRYFVYDGTKWILIRDYTNQSTIEWTPTTPGNYKIVVHAKDLSSTNAYDDYDVLNFEINETSL
jgi:N-acetylmuramoyl-L-alanine amidase